MLLLASRRKDPAMPLIAPIAVRPSTLNGISEQMVVSHYENNYGNAVRTLNAVRRELAALDPGTPPYRLRGLKREELSLMGSVALHELRLLSAGFDLEDLGEHVLKGIGVPVVAFHVLAARPVADRFEATHGTRLTPLVGRESELALLLDRWQHATEGHGQAVVLSGEPGMGKSRVVRAFRDRITAEGPTWVQYQCS